MSEDDDREFGARAETPLEMARRHVAEGEARCARQEDLLRRIVEDGDSERTQEAARASLDVLRRTLDTFRADLRRLEEQAGGAPGPGGVA